MYWAYLAAIVFGDGNVKQMEIAMRHNLKEREDCDRREFLLAEYSAMTVLSWIEAPFC
jgi:hypothetical protein